MTKGKTKGSEASEHYLILFSQGQTTGDLIKRGEPAQKVYYYHRKWKQKTEQKLKEYYTKPIEVKK